MQSIGVTIDQASLVWFFLGACSVIALAFAFFVYVWNRMKLIITVSAIVFALFFGIKNYYGERREAKTEAKTESRTVASTPFFLCVEIPTENRGDFGY